jgi:hypothetical protein
MQVLNVEEMGSYSKIDLRDVLWWKSMKDACIPRASIIAKFLKKGCISLVARGKPFCTTRKHD